MIKAILFLLLALPATAQTFHIEVDGGIAESPVFSNRYTPWLTVNEPEIKVVWRMGLPAVRPWNTLEARSDTCRTFPVPVTPITWFPVRLSTENTWVVVK